MEINSITLSLEDALLALDDAVNGYITASQNELADIRQKLAAAQADDGSAAELAADVQQNIAVLEKATADLQGATDGSTDTGTTTDAGAGTDAGTTAGDSGVPADGGTSFPV